MINIITAFQLLLTLLLLAAAATDIRQRSIPNIIPLLIVIIFVVGWMAGFPFSGLWWAHGFHFSAALLVGMLLFYFGWFGGGDAKLYAACALWFSFSDAILLLFVTTISGAIIVVARMLILFARSSVASSGPANGLRQKSSSRSIPYGVAIAAGGIVSIFSVY
ncbi:A24 family peptidase [Sphingopyxis sp.]|uniref:A24 family peptidase n=1 Tax=Sphingopyxis sp. TaxID=1908224 RepID=UPI002D76A745|nr:prepilin peptidase [Sphingopyxis sp.]HET6526111.1 prepilin peptidase [Sphingopyxis sp.]